MEEILENELLAFFICELLSVCIIAVVANDKREITKGEMP